MDVIEFAFRESESCSLLARARYCISAHSRENQREGMCGNVDAPLRVPANFFLREREQSRLEKGREVLLDPIRRKGVSVHVLRSRG
jgi:hypothetical protein